MTRGAAWTRPLRRRDSLSLIGLILVATAMALNQALLQLPAVAVMVLAAVVLLAAPGGEPGPPPRWLWWVPVAGCLPLTLLTFHVGWGQALEALTAVLLAVAVWRRLPRRWIALLSIVAVLGMAIGSPWLWGKVDIDVFWLVQRPSNWLIHGQDPYGPIAIYARSFTPGVRSPEPAVYLPGVYLIGAIPSLLGDTRVVSLLLFVISLVVVARMAADDDRRRLVLLVAIATPWMALNIITSWVDIFSITPYLLWLLLHERHRRLAVLCLALSFMCKPIIAIALLPMLLVQPWIWRHLLAAGVIAVAAILPFLLWNPGTFIHDAVILQLTAPTAALGLDLNGVLLSMGLHPLPTLAGIAVGFAALAALLRWRPTTISSAHLAAAIILTVLLLCARQAFYNYYSNVIVLLLVALATAPARSVKLAAATAPGVMAATG